MGRGRVRAARLRRARDSKGLKSRMVGSEVGSKSRGSGECGRLCDWLTAGAMTARMCKCLLDALYGGEMTRSRTPDGAVLKEALAGSGLAGQPGRLGRTARA